MNKRILATIMILLAFAGNVAAGKHMLLKQFRASGIIYDQKGSRIRVSAVSPLQLKISANCNKDIKDLLLTMWQTRFGRSAVIRLLRSKSRITICFSEKVGFMRTMEGEIYPIYAITGRNDSISRDMIRDYDKELTYAAQTITIFKGSFRHGIGDTSLFMNDQFEVIDQSTGHSLRNIPRDSITHYRVDPDDPLVFKTYREFMYLCGVHETEHTTSRNIVVDRQNGDAEEGPMKLEKKARKKLKKVEKSKKLHY